MSHIKVTPVVAIAKSQLRDDVIERALAAGYTVADVERLEAQLRYRKQYSSRPDVIEKRKEYTRKRYLKMKALNTLLKQVTQ